MHNSRQSPNEYGVIADRDGAREAVDERIVELDGGRQSVRSPAHMMVRSCIPARSEASSRITLEPKRATHPEAGKAKYAFMDRVASSSDL